MHNIKTKCSETRADELRNETWDVKIVGQTVPHPYEYLESTYPQTVTGHIGVGCPIPIPHKSSRLLITGPILPYIGSKTFEDTRVLNTWKKDFVNPLAKKSFHMLRNIDWFVSQVSNFCQNIFNNLSSLKGLDNIFDQKTSQRSGCPIHRFSVPRKSSGGFSSINPNNLRWLYVTAESWPYGNTNNMDFMHQFAMLNAQYQVSERIDLDILNNIYNKFILSCESCIREIPTLVLNSKHVLRVVPNPAVRRITNMVSPDLKVLTNFSVHQEDNLITDTGIIQIELFMWI